ncbi:hypothetical protein [Nonomuraea sp. NPDC049709]|uniref:hypothetical protein n=1 Tax=Nonomuraea sp. NPDC049709 TaxID=3154736 RepID=UPI00342F7E61
MERYRILCAHLGNGVPMARVAAHVDARIGRCNGGWPAALDAVLVSGASRATCRGCGPDHANRGSRDLLAADHLPRPSVIGRDARQPVVGRLGIGLGESAFMLKCRCEGPPSPLKWANPSSVVRTRPPAIGLTRGGDEETEHTGSVDLIESFARLGRYVTSLCIS